MVRGDKICFLSAYWEHSYGASIVSNGKCLMSWHDLQGCKLQASRALVTSLSLVGQRLIIAFGHIYVLSLPSVAKVSPNVDTEIRTCRRKAFLSLMDQRKLIWNQRSAHLRWTIRTHPLQPRDSFEVSRLVPQDGIWKRRNDLPVHNGKAGVFIAYHQESLILRRLDPIHRGTHLQQSLFNLAQNSSILVLQHHMLLMSWARTEWLIVDTRVR